MRLETPADLSGRTVMSGFIDSAGTRALEVDSEGDSRM